MLELQSLAPYDIAHREDFYHFVLDHAEPWHREHLGRLYRLWDEWNVTYFDGRMIAPYLLLTETSSPRVFGDCANISGFGGRLQIRLRVSLLTGTHRLVRSGPEYAEGRFRVVSHVLLHEMLHQHGMEVSGLTERAYHGHGPAFRDLCNRIGGTMGWPHVRISKARGKDKDLPSCAQWPHNVCPPDYYLGAYIGEEEDSENGEDVPIDGDEPLPTLEDAVRNLCAQYGTKAVFHAVMDVVQEQVRAKNGTGAA